MGEAAFASLNVGGSTVGLPIACHPEKPTAASAAKRMELSKRMGKVSAERGRRMSMRCVPHTPETEAEESTSQK